MFADVIFPLRLSPLTYKVPDGAPSDLIGRIVRAPLMNAGKFGLVVEVRETPADETMKTKELLSVHDIFASADYLRFIKWLSEYYLSPLGVALKSSFFDEAVSDFSVAKKRARTRLMSPACNEKSWDPGGRFLSSVVARVLQGVKELTYSSLLYHSPDLASEYSSIIEILKRIPDDVRGIIVLVPETGFVTKVAPFLTEIFGERLCILHSKLGKKERAESIRNILSGKSDVILGTRSAALAPLPHSSFLVVIEEQSPSYKGEEGLRYNARDLAVMRGYIDKSCVLLLSTCPSLETVFNARRGKYVQLNKIPLQTVEKRPRIKIVTFKSKKQSELSLSSEVISAARALLLKKEQVLFLVGRKGYSLIRCRDCGHIESCGKCAIPMIFYKSSGMLKCHHCGHERRTHESCDECSGPHLDPFSAGTERVKEEVEELLKSPSLLVEKARVSSPSKIDFGPNNPDLSDFVPFVIGTSLTKRNICRENKYSAAVLMNIDLLLAQPDFRAHERAFHEIIEVSQMVKTEGTLLIQTKSPGSKVLKCVKHYDFEAFTDLELSQRKDLDYPPYSRMVLFTIFGTGRDLQSADIWRAVRALRDDAVTILGPVEVPSSSKSYEQAHHILLKSKDNRRLHEMAKTLLSKLEGNRKIRVTVDVDPVKI
jgi:primosomal protein N' (replication factor Y) (superfamily II helicase)